MNYRCYQFKNKSTPQRQERKREESNKSYTTRAKITGNVLLGTINFVYKFISKIQNKYDIIFVFIVYKKEFYYNKINK